jgi:hypothetical protein
MLRDGRRIEFCALSPGDRTELIAAIGQSSAQSLYRRFFSARRHFTEQEIDSTMWPLIACDTLVVVEDPRTSEILESIHTEPVSHESARARFDFDAVGHYAQSGVFKNH